MPIRILISTCSLLLVLMVEGGVGAVAAVNSEQQQLENARAGVRHAHQQFAAQLQTSLEEGTPAALVDPIKEQEARIRDAAEAGGRFFVDRFPALDLADRARRIATLRDQVVGVERQLEQSLHQQIVDSLARLRADAERAHGIGVVITEYATFADETAAASAQLLTPNQSQKTVDAIAAKSDRLRRLSAMQAALNDANDARQRAQTALALAQSTGVLDVHLEAATLAGLDLRLKAAHTVEALQGLTDAYRALSTSLRNLLDARQSAYGLLGIARADLDKARGVRADVTDLAQHLDAAASDLDHAANLAAISAAGDTIAVLTRQINAAYAYARAHPQPPPGAHQLNVPFLAQIYTLDCEAASLQMTLAYAGINVTQDQILNAIGIDWTVPRWEQGNLRWGDPYTSFVGNYKGREDEHAGAKAGYGTYYPTIVKAAGAFGGTVVQSGEGIAPATIYEAALNGHPSVVWVALNWSPHPLRYYAANDGRTVMYGAPFEHAVTVAGVADGYVLINNPLTGQEWIDKHTFEASYAMYNDMAVVMT
jgi:uncharacterized protein YvpB